MMRHIFDPRFAYFRAVDTDLKRTFARVRAEQERTKLGAQQKVAMLTQRSKGKTCSDR